MYNKVDTNMNFVDREKERRGVTLYHLITMYLNPLFKKDLHTSFP